MNLQDLAIRFFDKKWRGREEMNPEKDTVTKKGSIMEHCNRVWKSGGVVGLEG